MQIGVYLDDFPPDVGGGYSFQSDVFRAFVDLITESNHKFKVMCNIKYVNVVNDILSTKQIPIIKIYNATGIGRLKSLLERYIPLYRMLVSMKSSSSLTRIARKANIDFIWFVGSGVNFADIPYLTVVWDLMHRAYPWFPEVSSNGIWDIRERSISWFLQRASAIVTGTMIGKEQIESFYRIPSDRITILPHPTPDFSLKASSTPDKSIISKYGIPTNFILYPAQFWPHKNHANLLLAVRHLKDTYNITIPVVFVGSDRGNVGYIRCLSKKLGLAKQMHLLGFVPQSDIVSLYQNAMALVYASYCGPENLPPLEALAIGCPVIASDIPGAREQLGASVIYFKPGDPLDIAQSIKLLLTDHNFRSTLIERGRERARCWTARDYVRGIFKILDSFEPIRRCWE